MTPLKRTEHCFLHPAWYVDQLSHFLTGNEEKVLNQVIREVQTNSDGIAEISIAVLVNGKTSRGGTRHTNGCGLGPGAARNALQALVHFGIILKTGELSFYGQGYKLQTDPEKIHWAQLGTRKADQKQKGNRSAATARAAVDTTEAS